MRAASLSAFAFAAASALAACASTGGAGSSTTTTTAARVPASAAGGLAQATGYRCPMQVPGTTVRWVNGDGYAVLDFETTGDVAELRRRVGALAVMHDRYPGGMRLANEWPGGRRGTDVLPEAIASSEDVDDGARLVFRPRHPSDIQALDGDAQMWARRLSSGECPAFPSAAEP